MTNWSETIKMRLRTEDNAADLEFEADGDQVTYIYLTDLSTENKERKYVGAIDTVDLTRIMARANELWSVEAEEHQAAEEAAEEERQSNENKKTKPESQ